jgi:plasmid maintenance system antidote protein VapI
VRIMGLSLNYLEHPMQRKPTSPGEILLEEFLIPLGLSQKELAVHLDCDYKVINRIINLNFGFSNSDHQGIFLAV